MGYPTSYRQGRRRTALRSSLRDFIGNESGLARFPGLDRGTWEHPLPVGDPVKPLPLRPVPEPIPLQPPDPATRRQQDIPWFERSRGLSAGRFFGYLGLAVTVADYLWPSGQNQYPFTPPAPGMTHLCGPTGWPGPPYQNSLRTFMRDAATITPFCGLGGQSFAGADILPQPNTHTIYTVWGPNTALLPVERWSIEAMDSFPAGPVPLLTTHAQYALNVSPAIVDLIGPGVNVSVVAVAYPPFPSVPREQVADSPYATTRSSTALDTDPAPSPRADAGGLHYEADYPEVRPRPRERERKVDPSVGAIFRVFSQIGTWHSFVNALWHSLPPTYSHRRRNFQQRLLDIYLHFGEIDLDRAIRYLLKYYVGYKAAGWAYGRAQKTLVEAFGPQRGIEIYRGLVNAGLL